MAEKTRTIKNWGARLGLADEELTLAEAQLYASLAGTDRLLEALTALQDIQMRLTRLELYAAAALPGYEPVTQAAARALADPAGRQQP